jgi:hypothetical protein
VGPSASLETEPQNLDRSAQLLYLQNYLDSFLVLHLILNAKVLLSNPGASEICSADYIR